MIYQEPEICKTGVRYQKYDLLQEEDKSTVVRQYKSCLIKYGAGCLPRSCYSLSSIVLSAATGGWKLEYNSLYPYLKEE